MNCWRKRGHKHRFNAVRPFLLTQPLASLGHTSSPLTDKRNKDHGTTYLGTPWLHNYIRSLYTAVWQWPDLHTYTLVSLAHSEYVFMFLYRISLFEYLMKISWFSTLKRKENILKTFKNKIIYCLLRIFHFISGKLYRIQEHLVAFLPDHDRSKPQITGGLPTSLFW